MRNRILIAILATLFSTLVFHSGVYAGGYDCEYRWTESQSEPYLFKLRKKENQYWDWGTLPRTLEHNDSKGFLVLYKTYSAADQAHVDVRIINKNTHAFVISTTQILAEGIHKGHGAHGFGTCKKVNND